MPRHRTRKKHGPEEIPQLKAMGLTPVKTAGHGNCLFHALSDQMYGDQSQHARLRADTVEYMRQHPDYFKAFVTANPGGGIRRNPKRKNAGAVKDIFDPTPPSEADINTAFELSLDFMARGGTYGDNAEVIAFSRKFNVDIRIWSAAIGGFLDVYHEKTHDEDTVQTLYIVHHTYEHYSSIRNTEGPETGLPQITIKPLSEEDRELLRQELANGPKIEPWMVDVAVQSLPYEIDRNIVEQTIKQCRGNLNLAVDLLLDDTSPETSERSSSMEREPDSEDEGAYKPFKKQDRRQSRPHPLSNNLVVRQKDSAPNSPDPRQLAEPREQTDPDETEDEDWKDMGPYQDSECASVSTSASDASTPEQSQQARPGPTRIRFSKPKKPDPEGTIERKECESQLRTHLHQRVIAKPRRRRLINGHERAADLAKKSARNQQMAHHLSNSSSQDSSAVLGIKAIRI